MVVWGHSTTTWTEFCHHQNSNFHFFGHLVISKRFIFFENKSHITSSTFEHHSKYKTGLGITKHARVLLYWERDYLKAKLPLNTMSPFLIRDLVGHLLEFIKISLAPPMLKIDNFLYRYTKFFPFFHIKIHTKIWGFPSDLRGCWGQRRPEKIKVSKFQIWNYFY